MKLIEQNKYAYFEYFIDETIEAGIALKGAEVKSIKLGNISLRDTFCHVENNQIVLKNCYVAPYVKGAAFNEDAKRDRVLLLHRKEINRFIGKVKEKGYTLVPTKIYFKGNKVKLELGLARGKHLYDKRETLKNKDIQRDVERQLKEFS